MNSDFTSKDTSLWSSGICIVLMASIKFSVDCSLCLDSVSGFSTLVKYLDSWQVGDPQRETVSFRFWFIMDEPMAKGILAPPSL